VKVFGQEINALTASIARMNLYLNGVEDFSIVREDTLAHPAFVDGSKLRKFDIVLANPPYSIKTWNREAFQNDKWGRNFLGTPPQGRADYAFFQHILASMDEQTGRCAILFPHGVLFRDEEQSMREKLIKYDWLDCVIGLGPNLFYNASMEACIIICQKKKHICHKGKVLFIDAKDEVTRKNAESYLEPHHIKRIVDAYNAFTDIDGFAKVVDHSVISSNRSLISIQSYVINSDNIQQYDFDESINKWLDQSIIMRSQVDQFLNIIE